MKTIIITGSTRGIGFGLADSFLALGHRVVISGRTQGSVENALGELAARHPVELMFGQPCNVLEFRQVQSLWDAARDHFGPIDIWINNAGVGTSQIKLWNMTPECIQAVMDTNVRGAAYGARVALRGMMEQGCGAFYNMEGLGSDGRHVDDLTLYGCTKSALRYMTDGLVQEVEGTPVIVGAISPGMVLTDILTKQYDGSSRDWADVKRIVKVLVDRVETVTPWIAERVLENGTNGTRIKWLTRWKVTKRFLASFLVERNPFVEE